MINKVVLMWNWSTQKYKNLSSEDFFKNIKKLSKKKSFLQSLNNKNALMNVNIDSPEIYNALYQNVIQFNEQEKEFFYKYYYKY